MVHGKALKHSGKQTAGTKSIEEPLKNPQMRVFLFLEALSYGDR